MRPKLPKPPAAFAGAFVLFVSLLAAVYLLEIESNLARQPAEPLHELYSDQAVLRMVGHYLVQPAIEYVNELYDEDSLSSPSGSHVDSASGDMVFSSVVYRYDGFSTAFTNVHVSLRVDRSVEVFVPVTSSYRRLIVDAIRSHVESLQFTFDERKVLFSFPGKGVAGRERTDSLYFRVFYNLLEFDLRAGNTFDDYYVGPDSAGHVRAVKMRPD